MNLRLHRRSDFESHALDHSATLSISRGLIKRKHKANKGERREREEISNGRDEGEGKTKKINKGRKRESRKRESKNDRIRTKKR